MSEDLQKVARELKDFSGNVRGEAFKTRRDYIIMKEGSEGVRKVEEKMAELGFPIKFDKIDRSEWVNEGINSLSVVVAKEVFGWTEKDIFDLGVFSLKTSFITRVIFSYFISIERGFNIVPKYWRRYYDFGELFCKELNKEDKFAIVQKKGYRTHPVLCVQHKGYFSAAAKILTSSEEVDVEETKCAHEGDDYDEYKISWK